MEKNVYEAMAAGFAEQLSDILKGATYDQSDCLLDLLDEMRMNIADESIKLKIQNLVMDIYSLRIDEDKDIDVDGVCLEELKLENKMALRKEEEDEFEFEGFSEDDFLFSL